MGTSPAPRRASTQEQPAPACVPDQGLGEQPEPSPGPGVCEVHVTVPEDGSEPVVRYHDCSSEELEEVGETILEISENEVEDD